MRFTIASLFCASTSRVSLNDVKLRDAWVFAGTVRELSWEGKAVKGTFAQNRFTRSAGGAAGLGGKETFSNDAFCVTRMFFQENAEGFSEHGFHGGTCFWVSEFCFCLTFELWIFDLHRDDGGESFAHIFSGEVLVFFFQEVFIACVVVEFSGKNRAETN